MGVVKIVAIENLMSHSDDNFEFLAEASRHHVGWIVGQRGASGDHLLSTIGVTFAVSG